jgi:hypothetical protein
MTATSTRRAVLAGALTRQAGGFHFFASRSNRSARSLAVSRRVACWLVACSESAFTPSCFHRNKRSARSFAFEGMLYRWGVQPS